MRGFLPSAYWILVIDGIPYMMPSKREALAVARKLKRKRPKLYRQSDASAPVSLTYDPDIVDEPLPPSQFTFPTVMQLVADPKFGWWNLLQAEEEDDQ